MFEMPKRKYLIGGAVAGTLLIVTIVCLAVFLPPDDSPNETTMITTITTLPTQSDSSTRPTSEIPQESSSVPVEETVMLEMLDAMQRLLTGSGEYDRKYYRELRSCMNEFDSRLPEAQDGAWQGMVDYWLSDGAADDHWGESGTVYMEQNMTVSDYLNMTIFEPCNYASNVAYYHDVTEFCRRKEAGLPVSLGDEFVKGFGQAFSTLAFGSSFMHGSHTHLGGQQDTSPIKVIALLVHQGSLTALPEPPSTILSDLSLTPRKYDGVSLAEEFVNMHLTMPVDTWREHTDTLEIPNYYLIFSGIFSTALTLMYPDDVVDEWVPKLSAAFGVPEEDTEFIMEYYLPEIRNATEYLNLSDAQKSQFEVDAWTTVIKLVYAFLWQEEVLTDNIIFLLPSVNELGMDFLPVLNGKLNEMNSFDYYEDNFQNGVNIYPGDEWCNDVGPHAKWHLESALGLLDLTYMGDEMYLLLSENYDSNSSTTPTTEIPHEPSTDLVMTTTSEPGTTLIPVEETVMLEMLDSMQRLLTGSGEYDREYYRELRSCMNEFDSRLPEAQDGAWQGMVDYWLSDGAADDHWGESGTVYMEQNMTVSDFLNMTIFEPCNYASNVAYYHDVTEFCRRKEAGMPVSLGDEYVKGFGQAFSTLAFGSSFMHGSHTHLGGQQDTSPIKVIALLVHQGSLTALPETPSTILSDLSLTPRKYDGVSLAEEFVNMHLTMPVETWREHTDTLEIPGYELIFSGIFSTALTLMYPDDVVDEWVPKLSAAFGVSEEDTEFIMEYYLPEIRNATEYLNLSDAQKSQFEVDAWTTVIKLVYAFLWQEEVLTDNIIFLLPSVNELGMDFLPVLNGKLNEMNSFDYYEDNFQNGVNIYPGDEWCNDVGPHAKWHLESALGLLDLTYMGDEMYLLLSKNSQQLN